MFTFKTPEIEELYRKLIRATDGTENCYDKPAKLDRYRARFYGEQIADLYVENWTGRAISRKTAEELCAGCHVYDMCKEYAMQAKEPNGIWGGTRPVDRGFVGKVRW